MPVTSFALLVLSAVVATIFTLWAMSIWGVLTVLPVVLLCVLFGRWAMAHVPHDDSTT